MDKIIKKLLDYNTPLENSDRCEMAEYLESSRSPGCYRSDTDLLDWVIFNSATIYHDSDDEWCRVEWSNRDGAYYTERHDTARDALNAAMNGNYRER